MRLCTRPTKWCLCSTSRREDLVGEGNGGEMVSGVGTPGTEMPLKSKRKQFQVIAMVIGVKCYQKVKRIMTEWK